MNPGILEFELLQIKKKYEELHRAYFSWVMFLNPALLSILSMG